MVAGTLPIQKNRRLGPSAPLKSQARVAVQPFEELDVAFFGQALFAEKGWRRFPGVTAEQQTKDERDRATRWHRKIRETGSASPRSLRGSDLGRSQ